MVEKEMQRNDDDQYNDDGKHYVFRGDFLLGHEDRTATAAMSNAVLVICSALSASLHDNSFGFL
jgi:hypothetical protein